MKLKTIIILILVIVISISAVQLHKAIFEDTSQVSKQNSQRMKFLFIIHIFIVFTLAILLLMDECLQELICIFGMFLLLLISIFAFEMMQHKYDIRDDDSRMFFVGGEQLKSQLETVYKQIYYAIYLYSTIGSTLTGLLICVTSRKTCCRKNLIEQYLGTAIARIESNHFHEESCPICLMKFDEKIDLVIIQKCKHIFHQQCLSQWLNYNQICPMDRQNIL